MIKSIDNQIIINIINIESIMTADTTTTTTTTTVSFFLIILIFFTIIIIDTIYLVSYRDDKLYETKYSIKRSS